MEKVCRNCCKIFCPQRDEVKECNNQVTFVTQMLKEIDKKAGIRDENT